jgi:hypothetical protein
MKRSIAFLISFLISSSLLSQIQLHPYVGLHISGDAEMYYLGPSLQAGADLQLRKKLLLTSYVHYFKKKVDRTEADGSFERGKFKTVTVAALIQFNTSRKSSKSFFIAGGFCVQQWHDAFVSDYSAWNTQRKNFLPAMRVGYFFSKGKNKLTIELNATGPYSYSDYGWQTVEILTQLSLGTRFIF